MYEYPPILQGTEKKQIADMRDYLIRLIRTMEEEKTEAEKMQMLRDSKAAAAVKAQPQSASAAAKPELKLRDVLEAIFSPGSLFINANDINPKELFGFGEWVRIKDRFILAAGETYAAGSTGGEATHKLTVNEMPSHYHQTVRQQWYGADTVANSSAGSIYSWKTSTGGSTSASYIGPDTTYGHTGGNAAHNNMPPYQTFYVWMRVS